VLDFKTFLLFDGMDFMTCDAFMALYSEEGVPREVLVDSNLKYIPYKKLKNSLPSEIF